MPQPRPPPPACAWVVVEARPRVRAGAASASAAILVLIDMRNSIRCGRPVVGPGAELDGACSIPVRFAAGEFQIRDISSLFNRLAEGRQALGPDESMSGSNLSTSASSSQNARAP